MTHSEVAIERDGGRDEHRSEDRPERREDVDLAERGRAVVGVVEPVVDAERREAARRQVAHGQRDDEHVHALLGDAAVGDEDDEEVAGDAYEHQKEIESHQEACVHVHLSALIKIDLQPQNKMITFSTK